MNFADDPAAWFPPERGPVAIIGNAGSIFTRHLAALWRSMGLDARLVTARWHGESVLTDGTPIVVTSAAENSRRRGTDQWIERAASLIESPFLAVQAARFQRAMGSETSYRPHLSPSLADAVSIAGEMRRMRPQFVCGQEVFAYGLATAFTTNVPRLLMPWGGDVYMYAETTTLAFAAVRHALNRVDLVVPGSPMARDYLHERFGVPLERMHCGGLWALDRKRFQRASENGRADICRAYGIDPSAVIVMNIRRFFPAWGSDLALTAFQRFAREHPRAHFVMLGGSGTESFVMAAREALTREGTSKQFTLFDGDIALDECARLMSVADIAVSLMRERDMRPFASILEVVSCGAAPILGDQPEYRAMENQGFRTAFCSPGNGDDVLRALRRYADQETLRESTAADNRRYLDLHEDGHAQALELLRTVRRICDGYEARGLRPPSAE